MKILIHSLTVAGLLCGSHAFAQFIIPDGTTVNVPPGAPGTNLANGETVTVGGEVIGSANNSAITGAGNNTVTVESTGILTGMGGNSSGVLFNGDGTINNAGTISANTGGANTGNGMRIFGSATVTNSGTIMTNTGGGDSAAGININGNGTMVTNTGIIITDAGGGNNGVSININNAAGGPAMVINDGTLDSTAGRFARGVAINSNGGTVVNNGDITTNVGALGGNNGGEGILIFGNSSSATNNGTINANGTGSVNVNGMSISGVNASLTNNGTITTMGGGGDNASGLYIFGGGNVTNTGMVTADGQGGADAHAIFVQGSAGTVNNSGTLTSVEHNGVQVDANVSTFMNSGDITGNLDGVRIGGNVTGNFSSTGGSIDGQNGFGVLVISTVGGEVTLQNTMLNGGTFGFQSGQVNGGITLQDSEVTSANTGIFITGPVDGPVLIQDSTVTSGANGFFATSVGDTVDINNSTFTTTNTAVFLGTSLGGDPIGDINVVNSTLMVTSSGDGLFVNNADGIEVNITNSMISGTNIGLNLGADFTGDTVIDANSTVSGDVIGAANTTIYTGSFTNNGMVTSSGGDGVFFQDFTGDFLNIGTITGNGATGATFNGMVGGEIANTGSVTGANTGIFVDNITGLIANTGTVTGTGDVGIALNSGSAAMFNSGTISGGTNGIRRNTAGNVSLTNSGGTIMAGTDAAVDFGGVAGDDSIFDVGGTMLNMAAGTPAIRMGQGMDAVVLIGSTVNNGDGTGIALAMGSDNDTLTISGFACVNATMNGNDGTDTLNLTLLGLTAADVASINMQLGINPGDPLPGTGAFTLPDGGKTYDWANFETVNFNPVNLAEIPGLTPNQRAIAGALNPAFTSAATGADMHEVLTQITFIGPGGLPSILNQLSPQPFAEMARNVGVNQNTYLYRQLDRRFDTDFDGDPVGTLTSGIDTSGFELIDPDQNVTIQRYSRRLASLGLGSGFLSDVPGAAWGGLDMGYDAKKMIEVPMDDPRRFGLWLAGQGILADVDQADGDLSDVHYDTAAVTIGLDYKVTREITVGALFNWGYTDAPLDGVGSRFELDTYQGGGYVAYNSADDGWYAHGYAIGGASKYDQSRRISFGTINRTANSSPEGWQFNTGAKGGYMFNLDRSGTWTAGPSLGLLYTHVDVDSYTETGAGSLNLNVGQQDADSLRSALGGKIQGRWQVSRDIAIAPTITAEWLHEFLDDSQGINGAFSDPGPGSFIVQTTDPERDYGLVGLGVDVHIGEAWSAFVSYDALFSDDYLGHSIGGGARVEF